MRLSELENVGRWGHRISRLKQKQTNLQWKIYPNQALFSSSWANVLFYSYNFGVYLVFNTNISYLFD